MKALCIIGAKFRLYADSSIHRNNQPAFLPEVDGGWCAVVCPAVRLSRLGTHISLKFAHRYYDSVSAACMFVPADEVEHIADLDERFFAMDSAFTTGTWIESGETPEAVYQIVTDFGSVNFDAASIDVDATVSRLSQFMTFKMGDMLLFPQWSVHRRIAEGDHVKASIDGHECLDIKIK